MMFCDPHSFGVAILQLSFAGGLTGCIAALSVFLFLGHLRSWFRTRAMYRSYQRRGLVS